MSLYPPSTTLQKWSAIGISAAMGGLFTVIGIYAIREYGIALFILLPLFLGAFPTFICGLKKRVSRREAWSMAFWAVVVYAGLLLLFAIEGLICIAMAAPLGLFLAWIGGEIACVFVNKSEDNGPTAMVLLIAMIPTVAFIEKGHDPEITTVISSIEIKADPQTFWDNLVAFPQLDKPTEFIFKTGIAYPTDARIEGTGVGAVRHCNFTTGSFVEPVTVWDEPRLLKFDVEEQPAPMKELSFWDVDAPHLHDYFVSKQGQFKLTRLPNGNTQLEGTTWYYHRIRPAFYWRLWSDHIVHNIHDRVLKHIKANAERGMKIP